MVAWRLAYSLDTLRNEVNARWPNRNKASDGTIGDPAHAATASDHNPNAAGVVCALDITNDPLTGPTAQYLFDTIRANPQRDTKYIIANRQISSAKYGWTVRPYGGIDPHTSHIHVSVGVGPDGQSAQPYDDRDPWLQPVPQPVPPIDLKDYPVEFILVDSNTQYYANLVSGAFLPNFPGLDDGTKNPPFLHKDGYASTVEATCAAIRQGK